MVTARSFCEILSWAAALLRRDTLYAERTNAVIGQGNDADLRVGAACA
jgi:hypothetical protein